MRCVAETMNQQYRFRVLFARLAHQNVSTAVELQTGVAQDGQRPVLGRNGLVPLNAGTGLLRKGVNR